MACLLLCAAGSRYSCMLAELALEHVLGTSRRGCSIEQVVVHTRERAASTVSTRLGCNSTLRRFVASTLPLRTTTAHCCHPSSRSLTRLVSATSLLLLDLVLLLCSEPAQVATLLYEMRRTGTRFGVVSMCIGTGMGAAAVLEAC